MNLCRATKQTFKIAFLFFFLLYAGSPLTCALAGNNFPERTFTAAGGTAGEKSIHVLLWEIIMKGVSSKQEDSDARGREDILIRKKRGLVPEEIIARLFPSKCASAPAGRCSPPIHLTGRLDFSAVIPQGTAGGFKPFYSGHSPPRNSWPKPGLSEYIPFIS